MNSTIRNHLDARRLEERAAPDAEVLGFWNKARQAYADALNEGSSTENRPSACTMPGGWRRSRWYAPPAIA